MRFSAAVLAGGHSTRMGVDKAFLSFGNELLIERQLHLLQGSGAEEVLISGRRDADYSRLMAKVVYDRHPECGPLGGLASVLDAALLSPVLVIAVDMPKLSAASLQQLLSRSNATLGCVPAMNGRYQPMAAVYPKSALSIVEDHLAKGRLAMHALVDAAILSGSLRALSIDPSQEDLFCNWNRPGDLVPDAIR